MIGAIAGCGRVPARTPEVHVVTIRAIAFQPQVLAIAPGDTVEWRNLDLVPHTVTSTAALWDSGNLPPDSAWRLVVPPESASGDSLPYVCRYHTGMRARLTIARGPAAR